MLYKWGLWEITENLHNTTDQGTVLLSYIMEVSEDFLVIWPQH